MDLSKHSQFESAYKNGSPLDATQKHEFNKIMKQFPDEKIFNPLNTTSQHALAVNKTVGAAPTRPARIENAAKNLGLN